MNECQRNLAVTPIVNQVLESFSNSPTIHDVIEEIVNLLGQIVIQEHGEAHTLLSERIELFSRRNGRDQLVEEEVEFYNYSRALIERQGAISAYALNKLKTIDLGKAKERKKINELLTKLSIEQEHFEKTAVASKSFCSRGSSHFFLEQLKSDKPYLIYEKCFQGNTHPKGKTIIGEGSELDREQAWCVNGGSITYSDIPWDTSRVLSLCFKTTRPNCRIFSLLNDKDGLHTTFSLKSNGHPYFNICENEFPIEEIGPGLNDGRWHKCEVAHLAGSVYYVSFDNSDAKNIFARGHFHSRGAKLVIGRNEESDDEFVGKVRDIAISSGRLLGLLVDDKRDVRSFEYTKNKVIFSDGVWHLKDGFFSPNKARHKFFQGESFKLSLSFKIDKAWGGILSFGGNRERELSIRGGRPHIRVSTNGKFTEAFVGIRASLGWHTWTIIAGSRFGEKIYLDGELVGSFPQSVADQSSKERPLMLGFCSKEPGVSSFTGEMKDFVVQGYN